MTKGKVGQTAVVRLIKNRFVVNLKYRAIFGKGRKGTIRLTKQAFSILLRPVFMARWRIIPTHMPQNDTFRYRRGT
jgi:hypothetical protein